MILNFKKYVDDLDLDVFLTNLDSLLCKLNNYLFAFKHHKHEVTRDLQISKNHIF